MSSTIYYKGNTLTTVSNATRKLDTAGKYLEDDITITDVTSGGGTPTLETLTATYTPSTSTLSDTILPGVGYDGIGEVDVTVDAIPVALYNIGAGTQYVTTGGVRKWECEPFIQELSGDGGFVELDPYERISGTTVVYNAVQSGTTVTPSTSSQSIGGADYMMEGPVTVAAMPSGTEGTPTATKGTVLSNSVTVTPSVTNSAGYIAGGTHTGTSVTVSASELVSGTKSITSAGTHDVANYANASVAAGSATVPSTASGTGATYTSSGTTLTLTKTLSITPTVSAGYVASGTAGNIALTVSATDANFLDSNIKSGVSIFGKTGTYSGGGSSWTKIGSTTELTVNTTSTSAASAGTIALGSGYFDKTKIIYVRIRDKQGPRNGYFYGSDNFYMNWQNANNSGSNLNVIAQEYYRYNNNAYTGASGAYGVYGYSLTNTGTLTIRRRYNSTNTLTINSTYLIDVYELTPPQTLFG